VKSNLAFKERPAIWAKVDCEPEKLRRKQLLFRALDVERKSRHKSKEKAFLYTSHSAGDADVWPNDE